MPPIIKTKAMKSTTPRTEKLTQPSFLEKYDIKMYKKDIWNSERPYCLETAFKPSFNICTYATNEDKYTSLSMIEVGLYQPSLTFLIKLVLEIFAKKVTFLDLGANVGYFSLWAAKLGAQSVASFEPVTSNVLRIFEAALISGLRVDVYKYAIADESSFTSYVFEGNKLIFSLLLGFTKEQFELELTNHFRYY